MLAMQSSVIPKKVCIEIIDRHSKIMKFMHTLNACRTVIAVYFLSHEFGIYFFTHHYNNV